MLNARRTFCVYQRHRFTANEVRRSFFTLFRFCLCFPSFFHCAIPKSQFHFEEKRKFREKQSVSVCECSFGVCVFLCTFNGQLTHFLLTGCATSQRTKFNFGISLVWIAASFSLFGCFWSQWISPSTFHVDFWFKERIDSAEISPKLNSKLFRACCKSYLQIQTDFPVNFLMQWAFTRVISISCWH